MNNEAERMRAKIEGKLNCTWCKHFHESEENWCNIRTLSPKRGPLSEQHCNEFKERHNHIKMSLLGVYSDFFPEEDDEV